MKLPTRVGPVAEDFKHFAGEIGDWVKEGVARMSGRKRRELAERFIDWSRAALADPGLVAWIGELDEIGRRALVDQLAAFCAGFGLDLAWLVDGELKDWPGLAASAGELVADYCSACRAGIDCQEELERFRRRRLWAAKIASADPRADTAGARGPPPAEP